MAKKSLTTASPLTPWREVVLRNVTMVDGQVMFLNAKVCDDLSKNKYSVSTQETLLATKHLKAHLATECLLSKMSTIFYRWKSLGKLQNGKTYKHKS